MKVNWKVALQGLLCACGLHMWKRTTNHPDSRAGFNIRACDHCPATQVYASELGRWIDNR